MTNNDYRSGNTGDNGPDRKPEDSRNDQNSNAEFPGYPHYPSSEDLMNPSNGARKISADPDEINRKNAFTSTNKSTELENPISPLEDEQEEDDELIIVSGTEADVTSEDLLILGPKDGDMDMGDDEIFRKVVDVPEDMADEELDIPGSELDDDNEEIGAEDEENNYYSLGGDRHDSPEEDNQQELETD